ncbi:hypothetical protein [Chroococcidiopsis sp. SAG 2025]|uniref:hypothetical protein n=1 Tax=Chroococcidiopsis sp. SAG 2025 TaxID=171389 RepID=UPI0029372D59|nr:hypothetical protein [Chroococcidiopsis sp. SAG 2025]
MLRTINPRSKPARTPIVGAGLASSPIAITENLRPKPARTTTHHAPRTRSRY